MYCWTRQQLNWSIAGYNNKLLSVYTANRFNDITYKSLCSRSNDVHTGYFLCHISLSYFPVIFPCHISLSYFPVIFPCHISLVDSPISNHVRCCDNDGCTRVSYDLADLKLKCIHVWRNMYQIYIFIGECASVCVAFQAYVYTRRRLWSNRNQIWHTHADSPRKGSGQNKNLPRVT